MGRGRESLGLIFGRFAAAAALTFRLAHLEITVTMFGFQIYFNAIILNRLMPEYKKDDIKKDATQKITNKIIRKNSLEGFSVALQLSAPEVPSSLAIVKKMEFHWLLQC
jgi:hypothetical protein